MRAYDNSTDMVQNKAPHWKNQYTVSIKVGVLVTITESCSAETYLIKKTADDEELARRVGKTGHQVTVQTGIL